MSRRRTLAGLGLVAICGCGAPDKLAPVRPSDIEAPRQECVTPQSLPCTFQADCDIGDAGLLMGFPGRYVVIAHPPGPTEFADALDWRPSTGGCTFSWQTFTYDTIQQTCDISPGGSITLDSPATGDSWDDVSCGVSTQQKPGEGYIFDSQCPGELLYFRGTVDDESECSRYE